MLYSLSNAVYWCKQLVSPLVTFVLQYVFVSVHNDYYHSIPLLPSPVPPLSQLSPLSPVNRLQELDSMLRLTQLLPSLL